LKNIKSQSTSISYASVVGAPGSAGPIRISTEYDFVLSYVIVEKKYEVGPLRVAPQGPA
jgi:hypothetical protein